MTVFTPREGFRDNTDDVEQDAKVASLRNLIATLPEPHFWTLDAPQVPRRDVGVGILLGGGGRARQHIFAAGNGDRDDPVGPPPATGGQGHPDPPRPDFRSAARAAVGRPRRQPGQEGDTAGGGRAAGAEEELWMLQFGSPTGAELDGQGGGEEDTGGH
ncbi:MAG: hypothetical protein BJ554DRAFT_6036 [Olpidium bornovanus]|uniref:Uncharacterized protein n=1 Tax=Olpidium bornovanus TaxID=278681 RepID=A0A8H8DKI7_9FUNG|nr:MAG: hypothetical protein BJ554DRAFT_6036 [Olpidium bornovanus]